MLLFLILICTSFFTHGMNDSSAGEEAGYFNVIVSGLEKPIKILTKEAPTVGKIRSALETESGEKHYALTSISKSDIEKTLKDPTKHDREPYSEIINFVPEKDVLGLVEARLKYKIIKAERELDKRKRALEMFKETYIK